jgi:hypothetical protein
MEREQAPTAIVVQCSSQSLPGPLSSEYKSLVSAVKPIFDQRPQLEMITPTLRIKMKTMVPTLTKSTARKYRRKKSLRPYPSSRPSSSDSDSDYGSRSKKKKKKRSCLSFLPIRRRNLRPVSSFVSSCGVKVPNYVDNVADFEKFDSDEAGAGDH